MTNIFQFILFYFFFLTFFSNFFYFDPEFFLSFSAFLIFFAVFAIINSYSDSLISEKYNAYKTILANTNVLVNAFDDYTTALTVFFEDIVETIFYFALFDDELETGFDLSISDEFLQLELFANFKRRLFYELQFSADEKASQLAFLLNTCAFTFVDEFDFENFKYPKHFSEEIHIWFYEPRSLRQLHVAWPVKPGDYIIPDWAYIDLLVSVMFVHFILVVIITFILSFFLSQLNVTRQYDFELLSAYECGFNPFSDTRSAFDVKFYLVAIFFIIFDLEIIFFFPLIVYILDLSLFQFFVIGFFIFQLFLGLFYEYLAGTLEW